MKITLKRLSLGIASAGLLTIYGCGDSSTTTGGSTTPTTLTGVAATGAAFDDATVTVTDAAGVATSCGNTAPSGTYTCTLASTATAPFVIEAKRIDSNGNAEAYYSVVSDSKSGTANITPLTTAIVAGLSTSGDPAAFKDEVKANKTLASAANLQAQVTLLETKLAAVISAATAAGFKFDPLSGTFTAGSGAGMDKILDAVKVTATATDGITPANVTISLRADPDTILTLVKGSEAAGVAIPAAAVAAVQATIDAKPVDLIANLLARMNTCYALPLADRVNTAGTGSAADVKVACQNLFTQDNPALFKSGGNLVGKNGAFKSLFSTNSTGMTFDRGTLEFVVKNPAQPNDGFWVVSYRATDTNGNSTYDTFSLAKEGTTAAPVLKQIGNQYGYDTGIKVFVQDRDFINAPTSSYFSTGYTLNVTNSAVTVAGVTSSIYKQVTVTAPNQKTFTLKPKAGFSYLGLVNSGGTLTGSNFIRLGYGYKDSANTATTMPASEIANLVFAPTKWTDTELAAIPDQGVWSFYIEFADNRTPVTQTHRTLSRAPTLAEVKKLAFAQLTTTRRAEMIAGTSATGSYIFSTATEIVQFNSTGNTDAWTVPTGAVSPTTITAYGNAPKTGTPLAWGNSYNDSVTVSPAARKATISCSRQSTVDVHCDAAVTPGSTGNYAQNARVTEIQMNAATPKGITMSKHEAVYTPI